MPRPETIQEHVDLAPYTTLKIGGPAKYFGVATNDEELIAMVQWAHDEHIPFRCIGRGANLLVSDAGYDGLVIVTKNDQMIWSPPSVIVSAGAQNGQLIAAALQHNLGGMRWLIGVPGTVGGSLFGNAGGHGWGLGDQVDWVEMIDANGQLQRLEHDDCAFAYRTSAMKQRGDVVIVRAQLHFPTVDPSAERDLLAQTTKHKNVNQPTTTKTAGCMFTNPSASGAKLPAELQTTVGADGTVSAWRLIDAVGLKGYQLGQVMISDVHANFMINLGGGTADQTVQLISLVKQRVRDTFNIQLHEEVQYLGFK